MDLVDSTESPHKMMAKPPVPLEESVLGWLRFPFRLGFRLGALGERVKNVSALGVEGISVGLGGGGWVAFPGWGWACVLFFGWGCFWVF